MNDPQWMLFVGTATGIIGAATGIAGAVMGWIAFRRSNQMKSLDLRLELRKAINEVERAVVEANELLPTANKSRERVSAARGLHGSGAMKLWEEQFRNDHAALLELAARKPNATALEDLKPEELEAQLAEVHKLQLSLSAIVNKYKSTIAEDDQHRAELRQAMLNRPGPGGG